MVWKKAPSSSRGRARISASVPSEGVGGWCSEHRVFGVFFIYCFQQVIKQEASGWHEGPAAKKKPPTQASPPGVN